MEVFRSSGSNSSNDSNLSTISDMQSGGYRPQSECQHCYTYRKAFTKPVVFLYTHRYFTVVTPADAKYSRLESY